MPGALGWVSSKYVWKKITVASMLSSASVLNGRPVTVASGQKIRNLARSTPVV